MSNSSSAETFSPPKKGVAIEFLVGLFAVAGVACFAYLAINIAGVQFFSTSTYRVTAKFDDISGLKTGADVEIAGVPVGQVVGIDLNHTEEGVYALVAMEIRNRVALREDDVALIRTKGIIGEKYVKISPGAGEDFIEPGGSIFDTVSTVDFEEIIGKFIHRMD